MRALYVEAFGGAGHALDRRAAVRFAHRDARGQAEGRGLVGVRLRVAAVESAVSVRRGAAGDAARLASPLLPVVAGLARHAGRARARARPRSRRRRAAASCYRLPAPLAIDELHLLWRREMVDGRVSAAWVQVRLRRSAQIVRSPSSCGATTRNTRAADDRRTGGRDRATPCGAFGSSPIISSARASRWSRTASSTRTSRRLAARWSRTTR